MASRRRTCGIRSVVNRPTEYIARFGDGEEIVGSIASLDRCLLSLSESRVAEFLLMPASPAKQLGSLALRVFGLKPRPAVILLLGPEGALVTFRDRRGGDYRVVNREFDGQSTRGFFRLHDGRKVESRADELLSIEAAFGHARDFFREGDRPWRLACRPVAI